MLTLAAMTLTGTLQAQFSGTEAIQTVASILGAKDDTPVVLEGSLIQHVRGDNYLFRDATGEIEVEIDNEDFRGEIINPEDTIRISGEVDIDKNGKDIDVDYLVKI